jgi:hypothetical protein
MKLSRLSILLCGILTGAANAASEPGSTGAKVFPDLFSSKTHAPQTESKPFANAPATQAADLPAAKATTVKPISATPTAKPVSAAPAIKPAIVVPVAKPAIAAPAAKPEIAAPVAKPTTSAAAAKLTTVETIKKNSKHAKKPAHSKIIAKPATSEKSQTVVDTITAWTAAWSAKDTDKYLAFYATDFHTPKGISHSEWETQRRERIAKPAHIRVNAKKIKVNFADESHVTVKFHQIYHSSIIKSADNKTLLMVKSGDTWLIQEERNN